MDTFSYNYKDITGCQVFRAKTHGCQRINRHNIRKIKQNRKIKQKCWPNMSKKSEKTKTTIG